MRLKLPLTSAVLENYIEADRQIKDLEEYKAAVRDAILKRGATEFSVGEFAIKVTAFERLVAAPIEQLKEKLGAALFRKVTRKITSERVSVKRVRDIAKVLASAFAFIVLANLTTGCSSLPRNKWTDKTMRVMIDPEGVSAKHYVRIQQALVASGKWVVVDRGMGYNAIKKEQERQHREQSDRFLDSEKYAHWGKLYGVGGVVVAHSACIVRDGLFKKNFPHCQQYLAVVDANTGEVIASAQGDNEGSSYDYDLAPSWDDVVADLNDAYPENYEPNKTHQVLRDYKELSQEEATRQREQLAREQAERQPAAKKE